MRISLFGILGGGASRPAPQAQPKPQEEPKQQPEAQKADAPASSGANGSSAAAPSAGTSSSAPAAAPQTKPAAVAAPSDDGRRGDVARSMASLAPAEAADEPSRAEAESQARRLAEAAVETARRAAILDRAVQKPGEGAATPLGGADEAGGSPYAAPRGGSSEAAGAGLDRRL